MTKKTDKPEGLALLREPFLKNQISKLPKPTKKQTEIVKQDFKKGIRCKVCGGWHHPDVIHLDYVGHAALTDRLLDCDPSWSWEPMAFNPNGSPALDESKGMWIKLTVCGQTRIGYGHPDGKTGGDAVKETIGDALRNAAMRFGAALDLWHKGDLHVDDVETPADTQQAPKQSEKPGLSMDDVKLSIDHFTEKNDMEGLDKYLNDPAHKKWVDALKANNPTAHTRMEAYVKQQREKIMAATDDCPIPQAAE